MKEKIDNETLAHFIENEGIEEVLLEKGIDGEDLESEELGKLWEQAYDLAIKYEQEKEEVKKIDTKQYGWSFSEDYGFDGYYDTLEECFKEARESNEDNKMIVFIGEKTEWESSIDGIETIEQMQVDADNELGEIAENFLVNVSREQIKELEDVLNKAYHEWLTKHNFKLDYITETKKYNLETGKMIKSLE